MKTSTFLFVSVFLFSGLLSAAQDFWTEIPYPNTTEPMKCFAMNSSGRLLACAQSNIFYTDDMGENWYTTTNWPGYFPRNIVINASDQIFIGTMTNGIMKSVDNGVTFTPANNGLTDNVIFCLVLLNNGHLLAGTTLGLFRSVNNGDQWELFGSGLPSGFLVELSPGDNGKVFAGITNHGIYRSLDYGLTWTHASNGLPTTTEITSLLSVSGQTMVYTALFPQGIYYSADDGANWAVYNDGLPLKADLPSAPLSQSLHGLTKVQQQIFVYIYAALVYYNVVGGYPSSPWHPLYYGLPASPQIVALQALMLTMLICCTTGSDDVGFPDNSPGLYVNANPIGIPGDERKPGKYSFSVNPNPVTSRSRIVFYLPAEEPVTLELVTPAGQRKVIVANKQFPAGENVVMFDRNNLTPGVYLLQFRSSGVLESKKVLVF